MVKFKEMVHGKSSLPPFLTFTTVKNFVPIENNLRCSSKELCRPYDCECLPRTDGTASAADVSFASAHL
jgi:hypothetical protein